MQLVSYNIGGNLPVACDFINRSNLAHLLQMTPIGDNTLAVFRCSDEDAPRLRELFGYRDEALPNRPHFTRYAWTDTAISQAGEKPT